MEGKAQLTFINTMTSALNVVDCYNISNTIDDNKYTHLNCSILNRFNCRTTINTCGTCYLNYNGMIGDHNTPCYYDSNTSRPELQVIEDNNLILNHNYRDDCFFQCAIIQDSTFIILNSE